MNYIQIYETDDDKISFNYVRNFDNDTNKLFLYLIEHRKYIKFLEINRTNLSILNAYTFILSDKKVKKAEILKRFNSYSIFYQDYDNRFIYREINRNVSFDLTNYIKRILHNNNFEFIGISKTSVNINFNNIVEDHFGIFKVIRNNNIICWKIKLIFDNKVDELRNILGFVPETKIFFNIDENYKPEVLLNIDSYSIRDIKFDSSTPAFFVEFD